MPEMLNGSPRFRRYESSTLESPVWHLLVGKSNCFLRHMFRLRWCLTRPLQFPLLPCLPVINLPLLHSLPQVTVGQLILTLPLIAIFLICYEATFVNPAKTSGYMATYAMLATILLGNKSNSVLSFLFGLSYERVVPLHRLAALLTLLLTCFHARVAFVNSTVQRSGLNPADSAEQYSYDTVKDTQIGVWEFLWDGKISITGTLAGVCIALLVVSSFFRVVRKNCFDAWLVSHIVLALLAMALCIAHKGYGIAPAVAWWTLDWFIRKVVMATYGLPREASVRTMASGTLVELRMRHFRFRAGQFVRIAVPELGTIFFHPFSISSAPGDSEVVLHIKPMGDWTHRLLELCSHRSSVQVLVEGPYGGMSMDLDNGNCYPIVLCLAGGIGVTPCRSIARQLLYDEKRGRQLTKVQVVWAVRDLVVVENLPVLHFEGKQMQDDTEVTDSSDEEEEADEAGDESVDQYGGILVDKYPDGGGLVDKYPDKEKGGSGKTFASIAVDKLQTDIFVTQQSSENGTDVQLPQLDQCNIHFGRPDVFQVLSELAKLANQNGVSRVAVICCGPKTLVEQARAACIAHNRICGGDGVSFDLHEEIFDY